MKKSLNTIFLVSLSFAISFGQINELAIFDSSTLKTLTDTLRSSLEDEINTLSRLRHQDSLIKAILKSGDMRAFNFVGGGDLNSVAQNGENAKAGNISLGLYLLREYPENAWLKDLEIDFALNVASTVDSFNLENQKSLGNYILNPINTRQSARLDFYSLFYPKFRKKNGRNKERLGSVLIDGAMMRFYASNANWVYKGESVSTTSLQFRLGIFHEFLPDEIARINNSSVMLGAAYGFRSITGDIRANDEALLKEITNTTKSTYWGLDLIFSVKFNNIRGEFVIPFVKKDKNNSILGLTDTQFYTQVRFVGGFPLSLKNEKQVQIGL